MLNMVGVASDADVVGTGAVADVALYKDVVSTVDVVEPPSFLQN